MRVSISKKLFVLEDVDRSSGPQGDIIVAIHVTNRYTDTLLCTQMAQTYLIPLFCLIGNPSGKFNVDFFLPALIAA